MEQKIVQEFLDANDCERFLRVLEITLQCREIERHLSAQQKKTVAIDQVNNAKKHMVLLVHAQLCRIQRNEEKCHVQHCEPIRNSLAHALYCRIGDTCTVRYCRTARFLTVHFETCNDASCVVCTFACKANGYEHCRPRPLFYQASNNSEVPCGSIDCHEFECNPFRIKNPPNKIGPISRTSGNPITENPDEKLRFPGQQ